MEPNLRAIRDIFGAHRDVVLNVGIPRSWPEILRGPAAGRCNIHQDRLGMVFHFRITEAANDGQQVGTVNMGDAELVPEDLGLWVMALLVIAVVARECAARNEQQSERHETTSRA